MKTLAALQGIKPNEYLIVLNPHEELRNKIMCVKKEFAEKYESNYAFFTKPFITLAIFKQFSAAEERIKNRLHVIAMGEKATKIELKDFGSLPAHSIHINITSKVPIQSLVKKIRSDAQRLMKLDNENKPHFIMEPQLTIARKLLPWQYEQGWLEYSHRQFTGRFIADAMLLLKRTAGQMNYEIAARFEFENLPVNTIQGALFS